MPARHLTPTPHPLSSAPCPQAACPQLPDPRHLSLTIMSPPTQPALSPAPPAHYITPPPLFPHLPANPPTSLRILLQTFTQHCQVFSSCAFYDLFSRELQCFCCALSSSSILWTESVLHISVLCCTHSLSFLFLFVSVSAPVHLSHCTLLASASICATDPPQAYGASVQCYQHPGCRILCTIASVFGELRLAMNALPVVRPLWCNAFGGGPPCLKKIAQMKHASIWGTGVNFRNSDLIM